VLAGPMIQQMMRGPHMQGPPGNMGLLTPAAPQPSAGRAATSSSSGGGELRQGAAGEDAAHARSAGVGIAPPARSERAHAHEKLDGRLPTLTSFSKPLLLQDMGDKGAAAMARFRALLAAHHSDKTSDAVPADEAEALGQMEALLQMPVAQVEMRSLPKPCFRLVLSSLLPPGSSVLSSQTDRNKRSKTRLIGT
jgi:hypothetical protein